MNATPDQFEGMLSSVLQSQQAEVTLAKQPVMAEYGRDVRAIVSALPPEVSQALMNNYGAPAPHVMTAMEGAIGARESAVENATQQVGIDQAWLANAGAGRQISEGQAGARDDWNGGAAS